MTLLYLQIALLIFPFWLKAIWWNIRKLRDAGEPMRRIVMVVVILALTMGGIIGSYGCGPDLGRIRLDGVAALGPESPDQDG